MRLRFGSLTVGFGTIFWVERSTAVRFVGCRRKEKDWLESDGEMWGPASRFIRGQTVTSFQSIAVMKRRDDNRNVSAFRISNSHNDEGRRRCRNVSTFGISNSRKVFIKAFSLIRCEMG
ncbi:hypothetical protein ACLB2K_003690 [Fragaria x ananassa]